MESMNSLLKDLIDIESISGNEYIVCKYLENYLIKNNWKIKLQKINDNSYNLFAYIDNENPETILCTHMDTVPPFFESYEDETHIYGRGSCDAKCHIVSMIYACNKLINDGYKDLGLLFTASEETDHAGIKKANELNLTPKNFIVGEPTNLKLMISQKGCINGSIECFGKKSHSGYPDKGDCAISKLVDILYTISNYKDFPSNDIDGDTYFNYYIKNGGVASNVINDYASAEFCIRCPVNTNIIREKLRDIVGIKGKLNIDACGEPIKLKKIDNFDYDIASYVTDLSHFKCKYNRLLFGAGSIFDAHTNNEKVNKKDLIIAVEKYIEMIKYLIN